MRMHRWVLPTLLALASRLPAQARQIGGIGLTVFDDVNFRGRSATLREDTRDLDPIRLNDRISSLRVARNEAWEVCEHENYRGRCIVVSGSERDLGRAGWSNVISSARRVRGGAGVVPPAPGLVLYAETRFRGRSYPMNSARPSLPGIVSQTRSVRVLEGTWEVCELPAFRGRCVALSSSVRDLRSVGLRSGVGSLRRRPDPR